MEIIGTLTCSANPGMASIIIPVHNRERMLPDTVQSALNQTYRPLEIIIVDDGSTDDSWQIISHLVTEHPTLIKAYRKNNEGPGPTRQYGLDRASGEFIQFLDSDDWLLPHKLEWQIAGLQACPECALSYGKTREYIVGEPPTDTPSRRTGERIERLFPAILAGRLWNTVTPLYRRNVLDKIGPWAKLRQWEDWEYECRVALLNLPLHYCNEFIAEQRHHHSPSRSGWLWTKSDAALSELAQALVLVHQYAQQVKLDSTPEMQQFVRTVMFWARTCGARGLENEANQLLDIVLCSAKQRRTILYSIKLLVNLVGWKITENILAWRKHFRRTKK